MSTVTMKPSNARVLALLRERGEHGATDRDALLYAHTSRLAARIHELRYLHGFSITGTLETKFGARYARYVLNEEAWTDAAPGELMEGFGK